MLHDRLLVRELPEKGERRSSGGLVIPDTVKMATRLEWGEVCGAGTNARHVATGDRVLYNPEDAMAVELQTERFLVLRERDVHAVANEQTQQGTGLYL
ncbi:GroES family chaperonin [Nocardiopsis coralliicola]